MSVAMDAQQAANHRPANGHVVVKQEESNNNNETNGVERSVVYDVLGGDDQELARRQYTDDEADELDYPTNETTTNSTEMHNNTTNSLIDAGAIKKDTSNIGDDLDDIDRIEVDVNVSGNSRSSRPVEENFLSSNGSSNGTSYHQGEFNFIRNDGSKQQDQIESHSSGRIQKLNHQSEEPEQMRKLFIGGLDYKTSEATLKQHFEKFGDVIDCVVMREPQSKRSRGFGFVIYASSMMVDKAQNARPHEVDGREVQSKRAISREDSGKPEAQATVKKVYLGGLSEDIEESELRDYFKDFGNIVNVIIVAHKDTGKRRGFAFVEYDDYDPVDKIVLKKFHTIKDKRIEAKKAIPKMEMDARRRGDPRTTMAGAMMALSGGSPLDMPSGRTRPGRSGRVCLWEGSPYNAGYPAGYSNQAGLDGYLPHYHPHSAHYGSSNWVMHGNGGQGGNPYGFRAAHNGGYGRSSFTNQSSGWTTSTDYSGFPDSQSGSGGPMRLNYQHRGWGPYGGGYGTHRGRGYNP